MGSNEGILPQYVIHGCVADANGNVEQVEDDKAEFFGLYQAHESGGHALEWLSDHPSRHEAEDAKAALLIPRYRIERTYIDDGIKLIAKPGQAHQWTLYEVRNPGDKWDEDLFEVGEYKTQEAALEARANEIKGNGLY